MEQQTVKFEVIECQVTGGIGLAFAGKQVHEDYIAVAQGFVLAHDLVEHPNGIENIGGVGDELEATGSIWYTRGQHHDMQRPDRGIYSPEESLAYEILENFRYWLQRGHEFDMPVPRSKPCVYDESIREILRLGVKLIRSGEDDLWDDEESLKVKDIAIFISACKHFMRSGIVKQQARFPLHQFEANNEFWNVQEAVEPFASRLEYAGQTFDLCWGGGEATMTETFEEEFFEDEDNDY